MVGHNTRAKETKDKLNGRTQYKAKEKKDKLNGRTQYKALKRKRTN